MKRIGLIFIAVGCAILAFGLYSYIRRSSQMISPVPEGDGVKVIYLTPGQPK
jgi:hypothetical protein